jgi:hypothetical protein
VLVSAYDARLFMLVECDARPGLRGVGGRGGRAGRGGSGGHGGAGGHGGSGGHGGPSDPNRNISSGFSGSSGSHGRSGHRGADGPSGQAGRDGPDGESAPAGSFAFLHLRANPNMFEPIQASGYRYEASVVSARVTPLLKEANMGGVFTPGSLVAVDRIVVLNDGGLQLPAGAVLVAQSTPTLQFHTPSGVLAHQLPAVDVGAELVIEAATEARLFDIPPPELPERFHAFATLTLQTSLNRPFKWSELSLQVPIAWPVFMAKVECPPVMSLNEVGVVALTIGNEALIAFGPERVRWELTVNGKIVLGTDGAPPGTVVNGLHAVVPVAVECGQRGTTTMIPFALAPYALLFERYSARVALYLDNRLIEFRDVGIRVAPRYNPNLQRSPAADVLLFTSAAMTRPEFVALNAFVSALGMSYDL